MSSRSSTSWWMTQPYMQQARGLYQISIGGASGYTVAARLPHVGLGADVDGARAQHRGAPRGGGGRAGAHDRGGHGAEVARGLSSRAPLPGRRTDPRTVAQHLHRAFLKLGVTTRAELAALNLGR